jgi:Zn-dependent protease with chaperone function
MKSTGLFKRSLLAAIAVCLLSSIPGLPHGYTPAFEENTETTFVLSQFRDKTLDECVQYMDRLRPKALTAEEKQILNAYGFDLINKDTEINNPTFLNDLYQKTQKVLQFHHRAGVVEYLLFKNSDPVLMTKAGAFIAISNRALKIAKNEEALSGIIAHELSHEYFAMQYLQARNGRKEQRRG